MILRFLFVDIYSFSYIDTQPVLRSSVQVFSVIAFAPGWPGGPGTPTPRSENKIATQTK